MSNLEQLLFERLQRWLRYRWSSTSGPLSPELEAMLGRRVELARQDWQAAHERAEARAKTAP